MSDLIKAYSVLGVDPGCSKETIQMRYKRMVVAWHPDRFPTEEGKADAEEEMKKILNARDLLLKHFESSEHRSQRCECHQNTRATESVAPTKAREPEPQTNTPPRTNPPPQPRKQAPPPAAPPSKPRARDVYDELDAVIAKEQQQQQARQQQTLIDSFMRQKLERQAAEGKSKRQKSANIWVQLLTDWKMAILAPVDFFNEMPIAGGLREPLALACVVATINGLGMLLFGIGYPLHAVQRAIGAVIVLSAGSFAWGYVTFRLSKALGGSGDFEASYRAGVYSMSPLVVLWIPFVNIICFLYSLFLLTLSLERAHDLKARSCSLIVLIEVILAASVVAALVFSGALNRLSG